jgi:predicted ATPase/DNA-binding CsgD family transcriptional regulator
VVAHNFPVQPTLFVGRTRELEAISELLSDAECRLLTFVGPGGSGKTRLSIEAALTHQNTFREGVYFVPLQALTSYEAILPALADVLCFQFFSGRELEEQVLHYLQNKHLLLVLDNFEHLLDGAEFLSILLENCPDLKLLVTSRERLHLREEWVYEVTGLRVPAQLNGTEIENYSAVQLFAQTARRVRPGFSLPDELTDVVRICKLVEGMPLALELAAAWVRALSCAEIVAEIERGLDILETPTRNVPARHRSMRAVIDHSWAFLSNRERLVLQKLSIFKGGFTRDAASKVAGASLAVLSSLVDKSWLFREGDRYGIHELLRQYAEGLLRQSTEFDQTLAAHSDYYAEFMRLREIDIKTHRQMEALLEIERDFKNVRAAWQYAVERLQYKPILYMMEALNFFCDMRARFTEGEELFRTAGEAFMQSTQLQDRAVSFGLRTRRARMIILGTINRYAHYNIQELEEAVEFFRSIDHLSEVAFSLYILGISLSVEQSPACVRVFEESLSLYETLNDPFYIAELIVWTTLHQESRQDAQVQYERALALQREMGDLNGVAWTLSHLARINFRDQCYETAEAYAEEALTIQRQRRDLKGLHWGVTMASQRALRMADFERARALAEEAQKISFELNLISVKQSALAVLGLVRILVDGEYELGAQLCREALDLDIPQNFMVGEPLLDATEGLVIAAYHSGNIEEAYRYYAELIEYTICFKLESETALYSTIAPLASLLLEAEGRAAEAVEVLSRLVHLPQQDTVYIGQCIEKTTSWVEKTPIYVEVQAKLHAALGDEAYATAWERGKTLDISKTLAVLNSLRFSGMSAESSPETTPLLTEREIEILRLAAEGYSNREIADTLVLATGTVKWYLSEIYSKLGVASRTQAIARARTLSLLP